jgi:hypothetical protein
MIEKIGMIVAAFAAFCWLADALRILGYWLALMSEPQFTPGQVFWALLYSGTSTLFLLWNSVRNPKG